MGETLYQHVKKNSKILLAKYKSRTIVYLHKKGIYHQVSNITNVTANKSPHTARCKKHKMAKAITKRRQKSIERCKPSHTSQMKTDHFE